MDVGATNLSLPSVQRLHCKNKEKRQNVSIGQTDDSIRIPTKSRLFFIVPSTAVVTWSVIKVVREAIRIKCDNTLRRPSRRHRHMSSLQKHRHESSKMSAKPLSVIRPTAIVALTRSLTRLLARSLTRPLPRAPAMSALSSASRGLFPVFRRSLHGIRVRFSVGFGIHEAEDATVLDEAAELCARPAPPPPFRSSFAWDACP